MKSKELRIRINKPDNQVFAFIINPDNTPKWLDSIMAEETSDWPIVVGTIYKNRGWESTDWSEYVVAEFEENELFTLDEKDGPYHVRYTIKSIDDNSSELKHYEWVDEGELDNPFDQAVIEKLKSVLESC